MTFDLKQLRAFISVVDHGSIGRACTMLYISQPALSRLLTEMESRLGQKLFERKSKGMMLTQSGKILEPYARHLLFDAQQAVDALDEVRGLKRGTVRIGAVASIVRTKLPPIVEAFLREYAGIQVQILEGIDNQLIAALASNKIDLAITGLLANDDEIHTLGECAFGDEYFVFARHDHQLLQRDLISLEDILAEGWVMPDKDSAPRKLFEKIIKTAEKKIPHIAVETSSPGAIASFVAHTQYLGWLPHPLFAQEENNGEVKALIMPMLNMQRRFFVYGRRRGILPPASKLILKKILLT